MSRSTFAVPPMPGRKSVDSTVGAASGTARGVAIVPEPHKEIVTIQETSPATENGARPELEIHIPPAAAAARDQDEEWCEVRIDGETRRIRFHDYAEVYSVPGLYERLFYEELACNSPQTVCQLLGEALREDAAAPDELSVLDVGAGNGMVGEELARRGVSRLVGVDIIPEAKEATIRDRPGIYDHYYVTDFCRLEPYERVELETWSFNALVSVAALGFGDIPPKAVAEAMDLIQVGGWIAFNIKDSFLDASDASGFSSMVRELIFSEYLDLHHLERYRHRLSIDGMPLNYFAIVGRKTAETLPDRVREILSGPS